MKAAILAAVLLVGCGGQPRVRPSPVERAIAIGLVTLGTGAATVAAQCPDSTEDEWARAQEAINSAKQRQTERVLREEK
jgi:hypothetical protein